MSLGEEPNIDDELSRLEEERRVRYLKIVPGDTGFIVAGFMSDTIVTQLLVQKEMMQVGSQDMISTSILINSIGTDFVSRLNILVSLSSNITIFNQLYVPFLQAAITTLLNLNNELSEEEITFETFGDFALAILGFKDRFWQCLNPSAISYIIENEISFYSRKMELLNLNLSGNTSSLEFHSELREIGNMLLFWNHVKNSKRESQ